MNNLPKTRVVTIKNNLLGLRLLTASILFMIFVVISSISKTFAAGETELLTSSWNLTGNNGAVEKYQTLDKDILKGKNNIKVTYNLHGICVLPGDASAIIIDQPQSNWRYVSLSNYGKNCHDGVQEVNIPLSDFSGLDLTQPVGILHVRFWHDKQFNIDITAISITDSLASTLAPTTISTPNASITPSVIPTMTPTALVVNGSWAIQSVSSMKESKDRICSPRDAAWINRWVDKAKELGANYIAVETPYENPSCNSSLAYTKVWVDAIRYRGLKVWHRHMPMAFEGIYSVTKTKDDYLSTISNYIKNNPTLFAADDIFTPIPEPQNGGISGITHCAFGVCQFDNASHFNKWLRDAIDTSNSAFSSIGLGGKMKIGYYGFDGFVAWGANNPDWNGILEDATIAKMGNLTIDHYPELISTSMKADLDELQQRYPNVPIIFGEWGSTGSNNLEQQVINSMGAAKRPGVVGFNYWHMGMGGNEALINDDFSNRPQFDEVQSFFTAR